MIQITNANSSQAFRLKLDGYSETTRTTEVNVVFTNQLTGEVYNLGDVTPTTTNGRFQTIEVVPPIVPAPMVEGLYMVSITSTNKIVSYATRLAFVSSVPAFSEGSFTSYTTGDADAYNVYTK